MKKFQSVKNFSPENPRNLDFARYGRLADSPACSLHQNYLAATQETEGTEGYERRLRKLGAIVYDAFKRRKAQVFSDAAEIVEGMGKRGNINASPNYAMVLILMDVEKNGWRLTIGNKDVSKVSQWTRSEMIYFLWEKCGKRIDDSTLTRIMKSTGLKLRRAKPGRQIWRRRR
jgi:hypothetical protein